MCGITGLYHFQTLSRSVDPNVLNQMTESLVHRGPDGRGIFIDGSLGLGHRRLSIIDLSPTGHQPMTESSGRFTICYNGEAYNHQDFRAGLKAGGFNFKGTSDTETLLALFAKEGPVCFSKIAGIFGLAIWDSKEKTLWLVRDPLGVKQVYYTIVDGTLVFGSEIKAILEFPNVPRKPNFTAISEYLHFHAPIEPNTFFEGIHLLEAGHYLKISPRGIEKATYLGEENYQTGQMSLEDATEELKVRLQKTIESQLLADVDVGCFVSGGIDSTVVAKYAAEAQKKIGKTVPGFGCYFKDPGALDEEPFGRKVSDALGLELNTVNPTAKDFVDLFEKCLWHQDEPKIGPAMISMWKVSELASKKVKVCLGGQAADELFGGYARYAVAAPIKTLLREIANRISGANPSVGATLHLQAKKGNNLNRLLALAGSTFTSWEYRYFNTLATIRESTLRDFFPDSKEVFDRKERFEKFKEVTRKCKSRDPINQAMYWDRKVYLPGLFAQDDRMSMAHSLETRVPLADPRILEFSLKLNSSWKLRGFRTKWILKQSLVGVVPDWVINRQKAGFDTPLQAWFSNPAGHDKINEILLGSQTKNRGFFNFQKVQGLFQKSDPASQALIWKLINIETWFRTFIDSKGKSAFLKQSNDYSALGLNPAPDSP